MNSPYEAAPAADFYCPWCGTKLLDAEVEQPTHQVTILSCATCTVETMLVLRLTGKVPDEKRMHLLQARDAERWAQVRFNHTIGKLRIPASKSELLRELSGTKISKKKRSKP
jgi:hypothetical protein